MALEKLLKKLALWEKKMSKYYDNVHLHIWADGAGYLECERREAYFADRLMDKQYSNTMNGFGFKSLDELATFLDCKGYK